MGKKAKTTATISSGHHVGRCGEGASAKKASMAPPATRQDSGPSLDVDDTYDAKKRVKSREEKEAVKKRKKSGVALAPGQHGDSLISPKKKEVRRQKRRTTRDDLLVKKNDGVPVSGTSSQVTTVTGSPPTTTTPQSSTWRQRRSAADAADHGCDESICEDGSLDSDERPGAIAMDGLKNNDDESLDHLESGKKYDRSDKEQAFGDKGVSSKTFTVEATLVEEGAKPDRHEIEEEIRNELLNQAVVGEAMVVDDAKKSTGKKRWWLLICIIAVVLVIIGVVIGAVVGSGGGKNEGGIKETNPVGEPADPNSLPSTTASPTTSPLPTWSPTISIENLDNGNIEEAHPLVLKEVPLANSGLNFQFQELSGHSGACDLRRERDLAVWLWQTNGLWYTYRSRTFGPVTAVLCGADGYSLELFSGEGQHTVCSTMKNGDLGNCGGTSVSWIAQEGLSYTILVEGEDSEDFSIEIVDNDECQFAFGPILPTSAGVLMSYSTTNAESDPEVSNAPCGGAAAGGGPGVWYLVEGTGRPLTASTCSDDTTFDTQISVYGGTCGSLTCLNGNDDSCEKASSVTWPSQQGELYYVLVQGSSLNEVGNFELTLTTDADRLDNDFCATAENLEIDVSFAFAGSTADDVPVCTDQAFDQGTGWTPNVAPVTSEKENLPYGIWYSVIGDGNPFGFVVGMPDEAPIVIKVLTPGVSGGCGDLTCAGEVDSVGFAVVGYSSQGYCFPTVFGQTYYIFLATQDREIIDVTHDISIGSEGCNQ